MAEVTSLTADKILEMFAGYDGLAAQIDDINTGLGGMNADISEALTTLGELNSTTLPNLQSDLSASSLLVSELNDTTIPSLQSDLDANSLNLEELNTVTMPSLQTSLDANSDWIVDFNENQIPALQAQLDANASAIADLDLTGLQTQLDTNTAAITDLNDTVLPALDTRITNAQSAVDAIDISGLQTDLDTNTAAIATLNDTTIPDLQSDLSNLDTNLGTLYGKFPITAPDISAGAVTTNALAADAVTAAKIFAGAIVAGKIATDAVTSNTIATGAVSAGKIAANSITATEIQSAAITTAKIFAGAVTADELAANAVTAVKLSAGAVVAGKIAADAVTANEIAAGSVTASEIATDAVTAGKVQAGAIIAGKIATDAVTAATIAAGSIIAGKLATDSVLATNIKAGEVVAGKLAADSVLAINIKAGEVVAGKLAADAVLATNIKAGEIVAGKLAAGAVLADNILAGAITADKLNADTVIANALLAGEITGDMLSANVLLASTRIAAVGPAGQSVELNPSGFYVYGPTAEGHQAYVSFPTGGGATGKPNIISGQLQASILSVTGDPTSGQAATFGGNSQLEPGATLTINNSVVPPLSAPTLIDAANGDLSVTAATTAPMVGVCWKDAELSAYFLTYYFNAGAVVPELWKYDTVAKTIAKVATLTAPTMTSYPLGVEYIGGTFYVLWRNGATRSVVAYSASTYAVGSSMGAPVDADIIGTDGTSIWLADRSGTNVRFRAYPTTLSGVVSETITTNLLSSDVVQLVSLIIGPMDFGSRKFILSYGPKYGVSEAPYYDMAAFTTTGARELNSEFYLNSTSVSPRLVWCAASPATTTGYFREFAKYNGSGTVFSTRYSTIKMTGREANVYVAGTYYRSSDGAETTLSPFTTIAVNSRWYWYLSVPTPPAGLGQRVYVSLTAATQATAKRQSTLLSPVLGSTLNSYDAAGALAPTVSGFGTATPGSIKSQALTNVVVSGVSTTSGSASLIGSGKFKSWMVGQTLTGTGIQASTTILSIAADGNSAIMSKTATATSSVTITFANQPKLMLQGDGVARITTLDEIIIGGNDDANTAAGNSPPLRVGNISGDHLRIDGNEIVSMSADAVQGILSLNRQGTTRVAENSSGMFQIGTSGTPMGAMVVGPSQGLSPNASGIATLTHNLGNASHMTLITGFNNANPTIFTVVTKGANSDTVRLESASGTLITSGTRTVTWMVVGL